MWEEENALWERVYDSLKKALNSSTAAVKQAYQNIESDSYEDKDAFIPHNEFHAARRKEYAVNREYASICKRPYFSHLKICENNSTALHMLLSDNADLETVVFIGQDTQIVPFKQSRDRPMLTALFHQYQIRNSTPFSITEPGKGDEPGLTNEYRTELIREVEIENQKLQHVKQLLPQAADDSERKLFDELLARQLEENRSDATLKNIISTLQDLQFDIIKTDLRTSFVVQGCAGSGKTQCLIHRLFFLRDELKDRSWERVLLLTPTQLFRNYSMDLMRRYRLMDVANCSLADFYCNILSGFDNRFKNRQYQIESTEEYLPDEYLRTVYAEEQVHAIDAEIRRAIEKHVREACELLAIDFDPDSANAETISEIVKDLERQIALFDAEDLELSKSSEYKDHRDTLDRLDKQLSAHQAKQGKLEKVEKALSQQKEEFDKLKTEVQRAGDDLTDWKLQTEKHLRAYTKDHLDSLETFDKSAYPDALSQNHYRRCLFRLLDYAQPTGRSYQERQSNEKFLNELLMLARDELSDFTGGVSETAWLKKYGSRCRQNAEQLQANETAIREVLEDINIHNAWIEEHTQQCDSANNWQRSYRSALERSRYYLSRIESSVFEQEVWSALEPLKKKYDIKTLQVERLDDRHQKQTKILYKSDLLFYIRIYLQLCVKGTLPDYSLICIDEGQDLNRADYALLKELYPYAAFNVFGDTVQALHEACGVHSWQEDTTIGKVYELNCNYRNAPEITDFCNRSFNRSMKFYGYCKSGERVTVCSIPEDVKASIETHPGLVVIVKDRPSFERLCAGSGMEPTDFDYLDTMADRVSEEKIRCYSVFAAKGLEFTDVLVCAWGMSANQKTVACTRAMKSLYYYE